MGIGGFEKISKCFTGLALIAGLGSPDYAAAEEKVSDVQVQKGGDSAPDSDLEKPEGFSLEKIMAGIDCSMITTLNGSEELTDLELLEVIKCNPIQRVEFGQNDTEFKVTIVLENGDEIERELFISFAQDLQEYLVKNGVPTSLEIYRNLLWPALILFILLVVASLVVTNEVKTWRANKKKKKNFDPIVSKPNVGFDDIGGLRHVKADLARLVEEIKGRKEIIEGGDTIPKGVLFLGPPGTGKTLAARAVAAEAGLPFISISGSELISKWVGQTQEDIRTIFAKAREIAKREGACILFIDEIDSIGTKRSSDQSAAGKEQNSIVNQLLVEMQGFESRDGVVVIAATNDADALDGALIRPGRFDRKVIFTTPDQNGRLEILKVMTRELNLADDVRLEALASTLVGASGAVIANIIREAKLLARRRPARPIVLTQKDLMQALDREVMGLETDVTLSDAEKKRVAVHEGGHTVLSLLNKDTTVERVTIVPRGRALGVTLTPPLEELQLPTGENLIWQIKLLLAGNLAERLIFGNGSTGAVSDFKRATETAIKMVTKYGMPGEDSELCEVRYYEVGNDGLDKDVDSSVNRILTNCRREALDALEKNQGFLKAVAKFLVEKNTIERAELLQLVEQYGLIS